MLLGYRIGNSKAWRKRKKTMVGYIMKCIAWSLSDVVDVYSPDSGTPVLLYRN
jgi:hypothetical protein